MYIYNFYFSDTYHPNINELVLEAHVRGIPKPEVYWVRDAQPVQNSDKYHIMSHEDGTHEVVINDPVSNDSGKYICVAKNSVKTEEYTHMVEFEAKPRVHYTKEVEEEAPCEEAPVEAESTDAEPADAATDDSKTDTTAKKPAGKGKGKKTGEGGGSGRRHGPGATPLPDPKQKLNFVAHMASRCVTVGTRLKMTCYVAGPEPQYKFLKNGGPCPFNQKVCNRSRENIAAIEFVSVTLDDAAEYTCIAKNATSEVSSSCQLTVYEKAKEDTLAPTFTRAIKGRCLY